ncbi:MAG: hypothetical protein ACFFDF_17850 [Candidatus Odinarchaeota archaeon]
MVKNNYLLDTTILIDLYFGSKIKKKLIENIVEDSQKYTTYLILGEFNRTILDTIRKILNLFLKSGNRLEEYKNINDFVQDVIKDMYFFSNQEASRVIKLIPYLKEEIKSKIEKYQKFKISMRHPIEKIIDDLNMYRTHILSDIFPLESSYECKNYLRKLSFELEKQTVVYEKPYCISCEINVLKFFKEKYDRELNMFNKKSEQLTKFFKKDEKEKFLNALEILLEITKMTRIDGRKRICWNLIDVFLILEAPINYTILTTNLRHQKPFAKIINKKILGINN